MSNDIKEDDVIGAIGLGIVLIIAWLILSVPAILITKNWQTNKTISELCSKKLYDFCELTNEVKSYTIRENYYEQ